MLTQNNYVNTIKEIKSRVSAAFDDLKGFWKGFDDNRLIHGDPSLATKPIFFAQTKLQALLEYINKIQDADGRSAGITQNTGDSSDEY